MYVILIDLVVTVSYQHTTPNDTPFNAFISVRKYAGKN